MKLKYSLFTVLFFLYSCGEVENGLDGTDGLNILVSVEDEPSGSNCSSGGKKVSFGYDTNESGVFEPTEVTTSTFICNGEDGDDGLDGLDGEDGNPNVSVQIVQWNSNNTDFNETDYPNTGDGTIFSTWTNQSLTSELVMNGVVLVQVGGSSTGPWFNLPYLVYSGDNNGVEFLYDGYYSYSTNTCVISWNCSFGRTYSEWLNVSDLYETYYKIITIEGN
tara:strand:- start:386 stop:1045 length:660 start_codon:yes stop_codon:yes gene_type:complete